jgi:hypothetical protein
MNFIFKVDGIPHNALNVVLSCYVQACKVRVNKVKLVKTLWLADWLRRGLSLEAV